MIIQHTIEELRLRSQERLDRAAQDLRCHKRRSHFKALLTASLLVVGAILVVIGTRLLFHKAL